MKYINIHTHNNSYSNETINIFNHILGIDKIQTNSPFSIGLHPWHLNKDINILEKQAKLNKKNPYWKAIGECGMDFSQKNLLKYDKKKQEEIFIKQIKLAEKYQKALIIHCVKCFDQLLKIKKNNNNHIWIIHGFSKNKVLAKQLIDAGFYLSFGAHLIKNKNNQEALKYIPIDRIFLETDEQTKYNIKEIYQFVAKVKNVSLQKIIKQLFYNYNTVLL